MKTRRNMDGGRGLWLAALASGLCACSAQVESDYPGEPIATLRGSVAATAALESDAPLAATVVWTTPGDSSNGFVPRYIGERVEVSDSFPSNFTLELFEPPPVDAEVGVFTDYCVEWPNVSASGGSCDGTVVPRDTGVGLWMGYVVAVDADLPEGEIDRTDIRGIDPDHVLVYYDHDTRPGEEPPEDATPGELARALQLTSVGYDWPLSAGYHVLTTNPAYQAFGQAPRDCMWAQLCAHFTRDDGLQDYADWEFDRCTAAFPDSPTCEGQHRDFAEGESEASRDCRERYDEAGQGCTASTSESQFEMGGSLDTELHLELGLTYWDAL